MSKKSDFEQRIKRFHYLRNLTVHRDGSPGESHSTSYEFHTPLKGAHQRTIDELWEDNFRRYIALVTKETIKSLVYKENLEIPKTESLPDPPINAEFILHLFLKRDELDAFIGDLHEKYAKKCERFGARRAKFWYYSEVVRSLWPLFRRLVGKVGGLIALGEWIRRHVS